MQTAIRCQRCKMHPARCKCDTHMLAMQDAVSERAVDDAAVRYAEHLAAIGGEANPHAFSASPYFRGDPDEWWEWDEIKLRVDQAVLAKAYVRRHAAARGGE